MSIQVYAIGISCRRRQMAYTAAKEAEDTSRASGENCESDLASGELPLKKITEAKEVCDNCGLSDKIEPFGNFKICKRCWS